MTELNKVLMIGRVGVPMGDDPGHTFTVLVKGEEFQVQVDDEGLGTRLAENTKPGSLVYVEGTLNPGGRVNAVLVHFLRAPRTIPNV